MHINVLQPVPPGQYEAVYADEDGRYTGLPVIGWAVVSDGNTQDVQPLVLAAGQDVDPRLGHPVLAGAIEDGEYLGCAIVGTIEPYSDEDEDSEDEAVSVGMDAAEGEDVNADEDAWDDLDEDEPVSSAPRPLRPASLTDRL